MRIIIEILIIVLLFSLLVYEHKSSPSKDSYARTNDSKITRMLHNDETSQKSTKKDIRYIYTKE